MCIKPQLVRNSFSIVIESPEYIKDNVNGQQHDNGAHKVPPDAGKSYLFLNQADYQSYKFDYNPYHYPQIQKIA